MLLSLSSCLSPQSAADSTPLVLTDGRFDDWQGVPAIIRDPVDSPEDAAVDIGEIRLTDDTQWLHLMLSVGRPVNAQSMRGALKVLFDVDGNEATGGKGPELGGLDFILELSRMDNPCPGGYGAGVGFRPVTSKGVGEPHSGYLAGLLVAPTHSSSSLELRIKRGHLLDEIPSLFTATRVRARAVFEDAAGVRDETDVFTYDLKNEQQVRKALPERSSISKADEVLRVVQWNVAGEGIRVRPDPYLRILAALNPDIILMDEVYGSVSPTELREFFSHPPLGRLGDWRFVLGEGGGRQKTVVATRESIRPEEALLNVRYPRASLDSLGEQFNRPSFREILALEEERGLATAGAWVNIAGREVLCVPLDLQSSGYHGSFEDRLRGLQANTLRDRLIEITRGKDGALIIGGDFNLVGSRKPLDLLRRGLDADGTDLSIAEAYGHANRSQITWRDPGQGPWTPGRLDFMLFSDVHLAVDRTFVFDTAELGETTRAQLGIEESDSEVTSRHLVVVSDFRWKE